MAKDPENLIAFQGIAGAHSDMACRRAYPYMDTLSCANFEDIFEAVSSGKAKYGLIPVENSQAGRVAEIHNILPKTDLHIVGEYFHDVENQLLAPKGATLETIKTVTSHPQALMQCRNNLLKLGLTPIPYADTARAAHMVGESKDPTKAAIGSRLAAELYGLQVLQPNMNDAERNVTIFLTFAKEPIDPKPNEKHVLTSLLFTARNIPAALYKALGGFATNGVNMLKLESYLPALGGEGTAQFFITFEGNPRDPHVQRALEELGFFSRKVRVLGVYPADKARFGA